MTTVKFSSKIFRFFFIAVVFLILSQSSALPQNKNNFADSLSTVLQKKLLLDNSQKLEIKKILIDFISQPESESTIKTAHEKISNVLNKKQKAKFDIIRNEWWQAVNSKRNSGNQKK